MINNINILTIVMFNFFEITKCLKTVKNLKIILLMHGFI